MRLSMSSQKISCPHDRYIRSMMADPRVAHEFFDVNLPIQIRECVDLSTLKLQKDSFIDDKLRLQIADVLFAAKINGEVGYFYLLMEHQSKPERTLPFRIQKYINAIQEDHLRKYNTSTLPFVYPMVMYTGKKPYTYSMDLYELYGPHKEIAKEIMSGPFQLIDLTKLSDEDLRPYLWFGTMSLLAKHIHDPDILPFFQEEFVTILKMLDSIGEQGYVIRSVSYMVEAGDISNQDTFIKGLRENLQESKRKAMTIAEKIRRAGKAEGFKEGLEKGIIQGLEQGIEQGIEVVASNMLKQGIGPSMVSSLTNLPLSRIKKIKQTIH